MKNKLLTRSILLGLSVATVTSVAGAEEAPNITSSTQGQVINAANIQAGPNQTLNVTSDTTITVTNAVENVTSNADTSPNYANSISLEAGTSNTIGSVSAKLNSPITIVAKQGNNVVSGNVGAVYGGQVKLVAEQGTNTVGSIGASHALGGSVAPSVPLKETDGNYAYVSLVGKSNTVTSSNGGITLQDEGTIFLHATEGDNVIGTKGEVVPNGDNTIYASEDSNPVRDPAYFLKAAGSNIVYGPINNSQAYMTALATKDNHFVGFIQHNKADRPTTFATIKSTDGSNIFDQGFKNWNNNGAQAPTGAIDEKTGVKQDAAVVIEGTNNTFNVGFLAQNNSTVRVTATTGDNNFNMTGTIEAEANKGLSLNTYSGANSSTVTIQAMQGSNNFTGDQGINVGMVKGSSTAKLIIEGASNNINTPINAGTADSNTVSVTATTGTNTISAANASEGASITITNNENATQAANTIGSLTTNGLGKIVVDAKAGGNSSTEGTITASGGTKTGEDTTANNNILFTGKLGNDLSKSALVAENQGYIYLDGGDGGNTINTATITTNGKINLSAPNGGNTVVGAVNVTGGSSVNTIPDLTLSGKTNTLQGELTANSNANVKLSATEANKANIINSNAGSTVALDAGADGTNDVTTINANNNNAAPGATPNVSLTGKANTAGNITSADQGTVALNASGKDASGNSNTVTGTITASGKGQVNVTNSAPDGVNNINGITANTNGVVNIDSPSGTNVVNGPVDTATAGAINVTADKGNTLNGAITSNAGTVNVKSPNGNNTLTAAATSQNGGTINVEAPKGTNTVAATNANGANSAVNVTGTSNEFTGTATAADGGKVNATASTGNNDFKNGIASSGTGSTVTANAPAGKNIVAQGTAAEALNSTTGGNITLNGNTGNEITGTVQSNGAGSTINANAAAGTNTVTGNVNSQNQGAITFDGNQGNTITGNVVSDGDKSTVTATSATGANTVTGDVTGSNKGAVNLTGATDNTVTGITAANTGGTVNVNTEKGTNTLGNTTSDGAGSNVNISGASNEFTGTTTAVDGGKVNATASTGNNDFKNGIASSGAGSGVTANAPAGKNIVAQGTAAEALNSGTGGNITLNGNTGNEITGKVLSDGQGSTIAANSAAGTNTVTGDVNSQNQGSITFDGNKGNAITGNVTSDGENSAVTATSATGGNTVTGDVTGANKGTVNLKGATGNTVTGTTAANTGGTVNVNTDKGTNTLGNTTSDGAGSNVNISGANNEFTAPVGSTNGGKITATATTGNNDFKNGITSDGANSAVVANTTTGKNIVANGNAPDALNSGNGGNITLNGTGGNSLTGNVASAGANSTVNVNSTAGTNDVTGNVGSTEGGSISFDGNKGNTFTGNISSDGDNSLVKANSAAGGNTVTGTTTGSNKGNVDITGNQGNTFKGDVIGNGGGVTATATNGTNTLEKDVNVTNGGGVTLNANGTGANDGNVVNGAVNSTGENSTFTANSNNNNTFNNLEANNKGTINVNAKKNNNFNGTTNAVDGGIINANSTNGNNTFAQGLTSTGAGSAINASVQNGQNDVKAAPGSDNAVVANGGGSVNLNATGGNSANNVGPISADGQGSTVNVNSNNGATNNFQNITASNQGAVNVNKNATNPGSNNFQNIAANTGGTVAVGDGTSTVNGSLTANGENSNITMDGPTNVTAPTGANGRPGTALNATDKGNITLNNLNALRGNAEATTGGTINANYSGTENNPADINGDLNANGEGSTINLAPAKNGGVANFVGNVNASDKGTVNANLGPKSTWTGSATEDTDGKVHVNLGDGANWNVKAQNDQGVINNQISTISGTGSVNLSPQGATTPNGTHLTVGKLVNPGSPDGVPNLPPGKSDLHFNVALDPTDQTKSDVLNVLGKDADVDPAKLNITNAGAVYETIAKNPAAKIDIGLANEGDSVFQLTTGIAEPGVETDHFKVIQAPGPDGKLHNFVVSSKYTSITGLGQAIVDVAQANYGGLISNFVHNAALEKRLGEVKYGMEGDLAWTHLRNNHYGKSSFATSSNIGQVGLGHATTKGDTTTILGAALEQGKLNVNFNRFNGEGHIKMKSLAFYGTVLKSDGRYMDLTARFGKLNNDFSVRENHNVAQVDYKNNFHSFGVEVGRKQDLGKGFYVTPQAQLLYTHLQGVDYHTNYHGTIAASDLNSLIARAGVTYGKDVKGNKFYTRLNVLHEFKGNQNIHAFDTSTSSSGKDMTVSTKGTWFTVGLGSELKLKDRLTADVSYEQAFGNGLRKSYEINVNVKYLF